MCASRVKIFQIPSTLVSLESLFETAIHYSDHVGIFPSNENPASHCSILQSNTDVLCARLPTIYLGNHTQWGLFNLVHEACTRDERRGT